MLRKVVIAGAWAVTLGACSPAAEAPAESAEPTAAPAVPTGPAEQAALLEGDHPEAYVTDVVMLRAEGGAKLYSTAGGDPAINGLYTYIAAYGEAPDGGWRVFQIGDFNSWSLAEDRGEEVVLDVSRSWLNENGEVQTVEERLIVSVPDSAAASITITPAG